tara:strand:+ start:172 stop:1083 length:912 start_codon:yes stop_codon:yes gene_type:complete
MPKLFFFLLVFTFSSFVNAQELMCNISVNSSQIQSSDKKIFRTLQTAIYEFVNNTKWTNTNIQSEEKIECSMLINISKRISNDEFEGTIQIQSTRPIYGTSYKSTLFNFIDNNLRFKYLEFQSLEFSETTHISNLTSVLAFYVNIILGLDFATFSEDGGNIYFNKAQRIVTNAQNAPEKGWKAFENDRNRYWIANNMLEPRYSDYQSTMYKYHRLGMDKLAEEPDDARYEITDALESLRSIYRENSSAFILQLFFDAKSEEITKIYSGAFPNEQARIIKTLIEIDPSRSSKYQDIVKQSEMGR